jgi:UDP-glucose 4-epimerase
MRIAVLGATGNAGTALLRRLRTAVGPAQLLGISRRAPDLDVEPYAGVAWQSIDIGAQDAPGLLTDAFAGIDVVVNLAWAIQPNHDEPAMLRTNVTGLEHVLQAAGASGVRQVVYASSVGAYSPGPKDRHVDESWPTKGIASSHYSRHKAAAERILDAFEAEQPGIVVSRLRPSLIFQPDAGSEIGRLFLGPLIPKYLAYRLTTPVLPLPQELVFQAVHADDVAEAYWLVIENQARGSFNVAGDPVITRPLLGWIAGARRITGLPAPVLRAVVALTWRLRLQVTDPGWVDMATQTPLMSTERIRAELGWRPRFSSVEAMVSVLQGLGSGRGVPGSPQLVPRRKGMDTP